MYTDRSDAGTQLGKHLADKRAELAPDDADVVVIGLPRGGLPVAYEVAQQLEVPLDVILVRKLGVPFQPEVAMGAIGEDDIRVINREVMDMAGIRVDEVAAVEARERRELERRAERYRAGRPRVGLAGKTIVIVDDGIATGSTAKAACQVAKAEGAARVILAVPVAPPDWTRRLGESADVYVSLLTPQTFHSVGQFYRDFSQVSDDAVIQCLNRAAHIDPHGILRSYDVEVPIGEEHLRGHITVPMEPKGLVVFAHGSGSSRHSARNRSVAIRLNGAGLATLLFDLLTPTEETQRNKVFDVELLGQRLTDATETVRSDPDLHDLPYGFFGSSTGAAAALHAAARPGSTVAAVVSRGGRPDLVQDQLHLVKAPTVFIVGEDDDMVLKLNRHALAEMLTASRLEEIRGATHLFEEPGALEAVADIATAWFLRYFAPVVAAREHQSR